MSKITHLQVLSLSFELLINGKNSNILKLFKNSRLGLLNNWSGIAKDILNTISVSYPYVEN